MTTTTKVTVDFTEAAGTIKAINGGNLGPALRDTEENFQDFKALRIPLTRLHDDPLFNPNARIVDIQHIFGNWDADENDKSNYYFRQTDDYIRRILEAGSKVCYRLGTSIEGGDPHYYAFPPEDYEKWVTICENIIRHYNEGWHNGFNWNIRYWEIWNEPDLGAAMWSGTAEQYYELYGAASRRLKARFPHIMLGGPAVASIKGRFGGPDWVPGFLRYCRDNDLPLDFFSCHRYATDIEEFEIVVRDARSILDEFGFINTEIHVNEWHYRGNFFGASGAPEAMDSVTSAVHTAAVLTAFQDVPLDMGCFYIMGTTPSEWACWKRRHGRTNLFYAFKAFALMLEHESRVSATTSNSNVRVLAGKSEQNKGAILLSNFKGGCDTLEVEVSGSGWGGIEVILLDEVHEFAVIDNWQIVDGKLLLPTPEESAMILIAGIHLSE
jgi:hypothetical protein